MRLWLRSTPEVPYVAQVEYVSLDQDSHLLNESIPLLLFSSLNPSVQRQEILIQFPLGAGGEGGMWSDRGNS